MCIDCSIVYDISSFNSNTNSDNFAPNFTYK